MGEKHVRLELAEARREHHGPSVPDDENFAGKYPKTWDLLTWVLREGDVYHDMVRLSLSMGDRCWQLFVSDAATAMSLAIEVPTLEGLWDALEAALCDPRATWRPLRRKKPKLRLLQEAERNSLDNRKRKK